MQHFNENFNVSCSSRSIYRWKKRILPFQPRGNKSILQLSGEYQQLLVLIFYRMCYPKATANEVRAFISNNSTNHKIFSEDAINKAEKRLELTRKV